MSSSALSERCIESTSVMGKDNIPRARGNFFRRFSYSRSIQRRISTRSKLHEASCCQCSQDGGADLLFGPHRARDDEQEPSTKAPTISSIGKSVHRQADQAVGSSRVIAEI
ncbi:hypothetical protein AcW1_006335 [Taiwanofungus camphoratus]|nr:hypothetical protein AcV5_008925 [Antrodia cinnamomea]KAI0924133.1 hypothetical protein AcW2_005099 [Antrodia cinnamomea]KAI0954443.1 hypothetical protein AcW1_006335 [Antrodia cinnamomea]